jgi:hypothetical protein
MEWHWEVRLLLPDLCEPAQTYGACDNCKQVYAYPESGFPESFGVESSPPERRMQCPPSRKYGRLKREYKVFWPNCGNLEQWTRTILTKNSEKRRTITRKLFVNSKQSKSRTRVNISITHALFCKAWMAIVSFRKVRGLIVFLPFLKLLIALLATPDSQERRLLENCFACVRPAKPDSGSSGWHESVGWVPGGGGDLRSK